MIRILTSKPRTMIPVQIWVPNGVEGTLTVRPVGNAWNAPIAIGLTAGDNGRLGQFWTEREGSYEAVFTSSSGAQSVPFTVAQQRYLPFNEEFGMFFGLWVLVMIGIIVAVRRVRWKEKTPPPCE